MFSKPDGSFNWVPIVIIGCVVVLLIMMVVVALYYRNKKKMVVKKETSVSLDDNKWVNALGGKENIISLEARGSRLIVVAKNYALINKDELRELGVISTISSQSKITLVLKDKAENISNLLQ